MTRQQTLTRLAEILAEDLSSLGERSPNIFIDPATGETYSWPLNHLTEEPMGKQRQMGEGARTDNIGLVPQQGAATPLIMQWKGRILTYAQLQAMIYWWRKCEQNSVYLQSYLGETYEVLIEDFVPQVIAVAQNRSDMVHAPRNVWDYTLTMRVLVAFDGAWAEP